MKRTKQNEKQKEKSGGAGKEKTGMKMKKDYLMLIIDKIFVVMLELLKSDEYLKKNGGLHYYKLSQKLGVDQKTIKNRIEKQTKSAL